MLPAQQQFLDWLESTDPVAFEVVASKNATQLGAWAWLGTAWNGIKSAASAVGPALKEVAANAAKAKAEQKIREKYFGGSQTVAITNQQLQQEATRAAEAETLRINQQSIENKRIIDSQLARAKQNLPPIPTPTYRPVIAPAQATPNIIYQATAATTKVQTMPLVIGGVALVGVLVLVMMRRR